MRSSSSRAELSAAEIVRPIGDETDQMVGSVLTDIAKALWPKYTAQSIATEINKMRDKSDPCAVRTIERYMEGSREWSSEAMAIIVAEIMRRHSMRNVRVLARGNEQQRARQTDRPPS